MRGAAGRGAAWSGAVPTSRAAAVLCVIALSALLLPVWLVVAAALALLAAAAADSWAVREAPRITRTVSQVLSRGVAAPIGIEAVRADGRRVLLRQPGPPGLDVQLAVGENSLRGVLLPRRRGRYQLPGVASASVGPLGLARTHHPATAAQELRVYPDLVAAQALIMRLRRALAGHPGGIARGPLGLGTDFEAIREYTPDDDFRQLNWRATARMGKPMSNQYRVERDRDLICLLDAGRLMAASLGSQTVLDASLDAAVAVVMAADEVGDRCGAAAFDDQVRRFLAPRHRGSRHVIETLFDLEATLIDSDFELAFMRVGGSRRALVLVFTDLVDEAAARSLVAAIPMLARRHALVVASPVDPALERFAAGAASESAGGPAAFGATAAAVVAADVLEVRERAAAALRHAGASVVQAPASRLAEQCLDAYLRAKSRAVL